MAGCILGKWSRNLYLIAPELVGPSPGSAFE
jgi:hypothetical protein